MIKTRLITMMSQPNRFEVVVVVVVIVVVVDIALTVDKASADADRVKFGDETTENPPSCPQ